jgi:hypothetical protein
VIDRRTLIAAAALALPACARAAIPGVTALRVAGERLYLPAVINGVAVEALLDSAAETSIVDAAFAAQLALRGGEVVTARGTGAATAAAVLVAGVTIDVAGLRLRPDAVAVIDLSSIARRLANGPIRLIIGRDLFDAAPLAIDIAAATLAVVARGDQRGRRLPLTARRGIETVPITIEGHAARADFDLGNGATVLIGADFAARHRLLDRRATSVIQGGGIGGETRQTSFIVRSLDIAGVRFPDVPVAIDASPTASDANIGVHLLHHFGIVTDFAARSVWLDYR